MLENKFYAQGVGQLLASDAEGKFEQLVKIVVEGTAEDDKLDGYSGADALHGFGGNDRVDGKDGDDWVNGGAGNDTLTGGKGADAFAFGTEGAAGAHRDVITDYDEDQGDTLDLPEGRESVASAATSGGALHLTLDGGHVIRLNGVVDVADVAFSRVGDANAELPGEWMLI